MKNPQAFPGITRNHALSSSDLGISVYEGTEGMTLRDYFAAKAMHGFLSNPDVKRKLSDEDLVNIAYQAADAMLKAREQ